VICQLSRYILLRITVLQIQVSATTAIKDGDDDNDDDSNHYCKEKLTSLF